MSLSTPDTRAATDDDIVVEAPTAAAALDEVHARLGPDATIVEAEKVARGGVGGFFAREMVQLRARPAGPAGSPAAGAPAAPAAGTDGTDAAGGIGALLSRLADAEGAREETFADALRRELDRGADRPSLAAPPAGAASPAAPCVEAPAAEAPPAAAPPAEVTREEAPPAAAAEPEVSRPAVSPPGLAQAGPRWSADALLRLGLPAALVAPLAGVRGGDHEWLAALERALQPLCRPLPVELPLLAGPRAHRLADALGFRTAAEQETPAGAVGIRVRDGGEGRARVAALREGRSLHVVAGGEGWRGLLFEAPEAISWAGSAALPEALGVAVDLGLPLGYGIRESDPTRAVLPVPVELALAVRALLPRS